MTTLLNLRFCLLAAVLCFVSAGTAFGEGNEDLRVFSLKNSNCKAMLHLLMEMSEGSVVAAVDERSNSLVVRAESDALEVIETLLLKLDSAPTHPLHAAGDNAEEEHREEHEGEREEEHAEAEEVEREHLRKRAAHQMEFLERRMAKAEMEMQMTSKTLEMEVANAESKLNLIKHKSALLEEGMRNGTVDTFDAMAAKAEAEMAARSVELAKQKLAFYHEHAMPLQRMEIRMQIDEAKGDLENTLRKLGVTNSGMCGHLENRTTTPKVVANANWGSR